MFCIQCNDVVTRSQFRYIRSLLLIRSANNAVAVSVPAFASVVSFVIYSVSGHPLDPGIIFSSLSLFNLLRIPLMLWRKALILYLIPQKTDLKLISLHSCVPKFYS